MQPYGYDRPFAFPPFLSTPSQKTPFFSPFPRVVDSECGAPAGRCAYWPTDILAYMLDVPDSRRYGRIFVGYTD